MYKAELLEKGKVSKMQKDLEKALRTYCLASSELPKYSSRGHKIQCEIQLNPRKGKNQSTEERWFFQHTAKHLNILNLSDPKSHILQSN